MNKGLTNLNEVKTYQITGLDKVFHFYKIGRVVWMDAPYDITTASAGVNAIGTAPDWLRPMRLTRFPIANAPTRGFFQIETNGAMSLYQNSAVTTGTNCAISGCYIAAE